MASWTHDDSGREFDKDLTVDDCQVSKCHSLAHWEGWHKKRDFSNNPTGLSMKIRVCDKHKFLLGNK